MARRRLFGAAAAAVAKARAKRARRSARRAAPAKRSAPRRRSAPVAYAPRRRRGRRSGVSGLAGFAVNAGLVGAGLYAGDRVASRLSGMTDKGRALALGLTGFALALSAGAVARAARKVPVVGRYVTPGAVALLGLGTGANAARRAWPLIGGPAIVARIMPGDGAAPAALPEGGNVSARPVTTRRGEMARRVGDLLASRMRAVTR